MATAAGRGYRASRSHSTTASAAEITFSAGISRAGPNRVISLPAIRITGNEISAESVMKIGSALMLKLDSKIASRAALPAMNPATTTSAAIVATQPARCWPSSVCGSGRNRHGLRFGLRTIGGQLVRDPAGPVREHEPACREAHVQDCERTHAEAHHVDEQEHEAQD